MLRRYGRETERRFPGRSLPRLIGSGVAHGVHLRQDWCKNEEQAPCRAALMPPGTRRLAREDSHQLRPRSVGACDRSLECVNESFALSGAELCWSAGCSKGLLVVSRED